MATFTNEHPGRAACGHPPFRSLAAVEGGVRGSRTAWLAGASLIALAAFGAPGAAFAGCTGADQTLQDRPGGAGDGHQRRDYAS